ncbi:MAG: hypothetical protein R2877_06900 [Bdellovibrionota bacterium]
MSSFLKGYEEVRGEFLHRISSSLISDRTSKMVEYAMLGLEDRGVFFYPPGTEVYEGMVVGEHTRDNDLNVNVCREKKLTNIRATSAGFLSRFLACKMPLETAIEWIDEDERIEITPQNVRIRKKVLAANMRSTVRVNRSDD